jgi:hypothetical protein
MRARPVPFCFHSFLAGPGHFVPRLGARPCPAARTPDECRTASYSSASFTGAAKYRIRQIHAADLLVLFNR